MMKPLRPANAGGTSCHRIGKRYRSKLTCPPTAVPTDEVGADAKRFEADLASLTVSLLHRRSADARMVVPVTEDGAASKASTPESLARQRLKPGAHRLSVQWEGWSVDICVEGRASDLRVVERIGSGWTWGTSFSWEAVQSDEVKLRAQASKPVADHDLWEWRESHPDT